MERRLAAILAADVVGYSRLMDKDEAGTLARLEGLKAEILEPLIAQHHGRVVKLMGDGFLVEFASVVDALTCALAWQEAVESRTEQVSAERALRFRIGVNLGDVIVKADDLYGEGVNVAARLEGLAEPGSVVVSQTVFEHANGKVPAAFEDLGPQALKNIAEPVRVFRVSTTSQVTKTPSIARRPSKLRYSAIAAVAALLVVAVGATLWLKPWEPREEPAAVERMTFPLPDKPSIAVLPFANLGSDPEQEFFADGITNDLITDLSKFNNIFVIAANSTFTYKGKPVKVQQVAEDLGVRYVLEGSVQRAGDTIRINAQLVDALSGHHLWAERYDRKADDFFAIQNEIIKTIIGTLQLQVKVAETERALNRPTENLSAYDYFQRGSAFVSVFGKNNNAKGREMFEKAIELDPQYARAYAELANIHARVWRYEWIEDTSVSLTLALDFARKSVKLDSDDYWNIWTLGRVQLARGDSDQALAAYERALTLNPHDPTLLMEMVELLVSLGRSEQAVAQARTAMRYNPRHPDWYLWNLGWAQYFAGKHEEAVTTLQKMTDPPNGVRRTLAPALVQIGRIDEAREMIEEYRKNEPDQTVADIRKLKYKHRPYVDKWAEDLLKAGLPE